MASPGRDKQEVSREFGARRKAKVSPSTPLQRCVPPANKTTGGGGRTQGSGADMLMCSAVTLGLRGALQEEVMMAFHCDRRVLTGDIGHEAR